MDPYWKEQKWLTNKILNFRCPKIRFSRFPVKSHHCLVPSLSSWKNTKNLKKWKFPAFWRSPKKGFRGKLCHYPSLSSATEKRHIEKLNVPSVDVQQRLFKKKAARTNSLVPLVSWMFLLLGKKFFTTRHHPPNPEETCKLHVPACCSFKASMFNNFGHNPG